jgi:Skp family chaperone for outer membrane proteins
MKRIHLIVAALLVTATVVTSALAQTRPGTTAPRPAAPQTPAAGNAPIPNSRIAFVDTSMFGDEKNGITRYVNIGKALEREFQPSQTELVNMQNRLKAIADEINRLGASTVADPKTIQAKRDEGERLQRDLQRKKEDYDARFEKRYGEVMAPLTAEIGKALDQFALQRGITMTLDISKIGPALLTAIPAMDVTQAFIADFNSKNPAPRP